MIRNKWKNISWGQDVAWQLNLNSAADMHALLVGSAKTSFTNCQTHAKQRAEDDRGSRYEGSRSCEALWTNRDGRDWKLVCVCLSPSFISAAGERGSNLNPSVFWFKFSLLEQTKEGSLWCEAAVAVSVTRSPTIPPCWGVEDVISLFFERGRDTKKRDERRINQTDDSCWKAYKSLEWGGRVLDISVDGLFLSSPHPSCWCQYTILANSFSSSS